MAWDDVPTDRFIANCLTDRVFARKISIVEAQVLGRKFGRQLAAIRALPETQERND